MNCTAESISSLLGSSRSMQELRQQILQVAPTNETLLITGECGTGKDLVARAIHGASLRAGAAVLRLNCAAFSAHTLASEFFGHEAGAVPGFDQRHKGRFELADGGTILLDDIAELPLQLQARLRRMLEEGYIERVGGATSIEVDVRVIAMSERALEPEIAAGRLRADLYYRLAVVPIAVPPLRERREDVAELAEHFLRMAARRLRRAPCEFRPTALTLLEEYAWPGNVRELENIATRASVLNNGRPISADDVRPWLEPTKTSLPNTQTSAGETIVPGTNLQEMERRMIESTLEHFGGHRARTAEALGIGIRTLSGKLKEYGYAPRAKSVPHAHVRF